MILCVTISQCFFDIFLRLKSKNCNIETIVIMHFYNRPMKREYLTVSDRLTSNDYMVLCVTISQCFGPFLRLKSKNCNIETIVIMYFYNRPMKREYLTVSDRLTLNDYMVLCYTGAVPVLS